MVYSISGSGSRRKQSTAGHTRASAAIPDAGEIGVGARTPRERAGERDGPKEKEPTGAPEAYSVGQATQKEPCVRHFASPALKKDAGVYKFWGTV